MKVQFLKTPLLQKNPPYLSASQRLREGFLELGQMSLGQKEGRGAIFFDLGGRLA